MIKELNRNYKTDWNEEIKLSLSLRELQLIYDCIGAVPLNYIDYKHGASRFKNEYDADTLCDIYNDLDELIIAHNGLSDTDSSLNCDKVLMIEKE